MKLATFILFASALCSAQITCPTGVNHCANVSWTAGTGGTATSYNVYQSTTNGGCATLTATTCTKAGSTVTTSYMVSPLTKTTTYYFVVTGVNATGESAGSTQVSGTTGDDVPGTPQTIIIQVK